MNKISIILLPLSQLFIINNVLSAKILYLNHLGCNSTTSFHQAIIKILLENHHEIIAISPLLFHENLANYTDLGVHDAYFKFSDEFSLEDQLIGTYVNRKLVYEILQENCENIYRNSKLSKTLENTKVDLVIMEIDSAECFYPLLAQFQAPVIGVSTTPFLFPDFEEFMGNSVNPSYVPSLLSGFSSRMNFFQRMQNAKDYVLNSAIAWYYTNEADKMIAKYKRSPPIRELHDKISLLFSNSHISFMSKPVAPSTIDIAGIHIGNLSPLPKDIQTFIDESPKGVIYLSLGSVAKFSGLPKLIHDSFVKAIQKLPYRVIWRHDKPEMIPVSENILVQRWLPQKEILAHQKVILFISHCGIFSTYEAIHFGIPMLTLPVLYDQFTNAAVIENLEIGVPLDLHNFDQYSLTSKIEEILKNDKYQKNVLKLSSVFKDRLQSARETLIYWVNYVLRHKDVSFLKPAGAKLPFYQYLLLDVILFCILTSILIVWIIYSTLKLSISVLTQIFSKKSKIKDKKP